MATDMATDEKLKQRVQKLLNQAKDREGTPEGDSFYEKAFALMAQYGFEQRDLRQADEGDTVERRTYTFKGAYTEMQAHLLHAIARGLHCTGFTYRVPRSTRVHSVTVFGLRRHLDRMDMLYSLLQPVMLAGARTKRATSWAQSTVVVRRSYMAGFAASISARLEAAEARAAEADGEYGLMLLDDYDKALAAQSQYLEDEDLYLTGHQSNRSLDANAFLQGHDAGDRSDLGQTRVHARPALPF